MTARGTRAQTRSGTQVIPGFDPAVAHPARVYNVWLGGKDHYAPDRAAAQRVVEVPPAGGRGGAGEPAVAWAGWSGTWRDTAGISQFLDIGTGVTGPGQHPRGGPVPQPGGPHRLRRQRSARADPRPRPADRHARKDPATTSTRTCTTRPPSWPGRPGPWTSPARPRSCSWPCCHFLPEADDPAGIVGPALAAGLAPGSFVAVAHLTSDFAPAAVASGVRGLQRGRAARDHRPLARPGHRPARRPAPGPARGGASRASGAPIRAGCASPPTSSPPSHRPARSRYQPGYLPAAQQKSGPITDPTGPPRTPAGDRPHCTGGPGAGSAAAGPRTRPGGEPAADAGSSRPADRCRADRLPQRHPRHP